MVCLPSLFVSMPTQNSASLHYSRNGEKKNITETSIVAFWFSFTVQFILLLSLLLIGCAVTTYLFSVSCQVDQFCVGLSRTWNIALHCCEYVHVYIWSRLFSFLIPFTIQFKCSCGTMDMCAVQRCLVSGFTTVIVINTWAGSHALMPSMTYHTELGVDTAMQSVDIAVQHYISYATEIPDSTYSLT